MVGVLAFNLGVYYWFAAAHEATQFFRASFYTRAYVFVVFIVFVSIGLVHWLLILIGSVDLLGGVWTLMALKQDRTHSPRPAFAQR